MILHDIVASEDHEAYQRLELANLGRQYDFLQSIIVAAVDTDHLMVSTTVINALNHHAISCLHIHAGQYRQCQVAVGDHEPPPHYRVPDLMNHFVNEVNRMWNGTDPITLASYCLWRLNYIHPFINGNGRTARALCYYVLCVGHGGVLPGSPILPALIRENRDDYVRILRTVDDAYTRRDEAWLLPLSEFVARLLEEQLRSAQE